MKLIMVVGSLTPEEKERLGEMRFGYPASVVLKELILLNPSVKEEDFKELSGNSEEILEQLQLALLEWENENICLIYLGHGQENGWAVGGLRDAGVVYYDFLRTIMALHKANLIFLNACCYGFAAKTVLDFHNSNLFLAAAPEGRMGYLEPFFKNIFDCWKNHRPAYYGLDEGGKFIPLWDGDEKLNELMYPIKIQSSV